MALLEGEAEIINKDYLKPDVHHILPRRFHSERNSCLGDKGVLPRCPTEMDDDERPIQKYATKNMQKHAKICQKYAKNMHYPHDNRS